MNDMDEKKTKPFDDEDWDDMQDDEVMKELKELWAYQNERIEAILARQESMPKRITGHGRVPYRNVQMAWSLVLSIVGAGLCITALATLRGDSCARQQLIGCVVAASGALVSIRSAWTNLTLRSHRPDTDGVSAMARLSVRMHATPHYAARRYRQQGVPNTFGGMLREAASSMTQLSTLCVMAIAVLTFVSCSTIGDSHVMTGFDRSARMAVIKNVDTIMAQL